MQIVPNQREVQKKRAIKAMPDDPSGFMIYFLVQVHWYIHQKYLCVFASCDFKSIRIPDTEAIALAQVLAGNVNFPFNNEGVYAITRFLRSVGALKATFQLAHVEPSILVYPHTIIIWIG